MTPPMRRGTPVTIRHAKHEHASAPDTMQAVPSPPPPLSSFLTGMALSSSTSPSPSCLLLPLLALPSPRRRSPAPDMTPNHVRGWRRFFRFLQRIKTWENGRFEKDRASTENESCSQKYRSTMLLPCCISRTFTRQTVEFAFCASKQRCSTNESWQVPKTPTNARSPPLQVRSAVEYRLTGFAKHESRALNTGSSWGYRNPPGTGARAGPGAENL